jgi:hypothetical protein
VDRRRARRRAARPARRRAARSARRAGGAALIAALIVLALAAGQARDDSRSLAEVVERFPDRARFVAYGVDGAGAPLWALRIGAAAQGERPALTVVPALDEELDDALLVALAAELCAAADAPCDWWLVAAPLAGGARASRARDFPAGWTPPPDVRGAFPLSAPETRALAEHLVYLPRAAGVVELRRGAAPAGDGGTLLRFAREHLDLPAESVPATGDGPRLAARLARFAEGCAQLEVRDAVVRRLAPELWEVECTLGNAGRFAAAPARTPPAHPARRVTVRCRGPLLLAGALEGEEGFRALARDARRWDLGPLPGGSAARVRLVVRGAPGELLTLEVGAARARGARASIELAPTPTPR